MQQGSPGDGIIGRTASLLDENSETFAILPWHFQAGFHIDHSDLVVLVPGYDNYPHAFKEGIPLLVACGIKHFDFLNSNYAESHKIRESFFWSRADIRSKLEPFIHGGILQSTGNPSMKATGVSPLTILLKRISDLESKNDGTSGEATKNLLNEIETSVDALVQRDIVPPITNNALQV